MPSCCYHPKTSFFISYSVLLLDLYIKFLIYYSVFMKSYSSHISINTVNNFSEKWGITCISILKRQLKNYPEK